jgi:uncharacterized membrane protein YqhA
MSMDPRIDTPLAWLIGRSRLIVVLAVLAVLLAAFSLFLLGAWLSVSTVWSTWRDAGGNDVGSTEIVVRFLEIVTVMLKAVFFYLIGVGFYSLFIAPLNVTVALGVESLNEGQQAAKRRDQDRARLEMFERAHEKQDVAKAADPVQDRPTSQQ